MRFLAYSLLFMLVWGHLEARRRDSGRSRSSSSSSSSGRPSFKTKVKQTLGFKKKPASTGYGSTTARKSVGTKIKEKLGIKKKTPSTGSSYPTQQWGSSGGTGGSGIGGFSQPKPPSNNFGGTGIGGFSQPKAPANNFGSGGLAAGGLAGAGAGGLAGGLAGSHMGGGGFSAPKPANSFGGGGFNNNPIGGGGFVQPKPAGNSFGMTNSNPVRSGNTFGTNQGNSFGGGGFASNQGNSFGGGGFNTKNMAGAGLAGGAMGGVLGGGAKQYSSFSKPTSSFGSFSAPGGKNYGSKTPGYGTNWGTNFAGGVGQYGKQKKGISKKALGLGIGAGFLGGAALGVAGTMATYSVYHKYQEYKRMMHMRPGGGGMGGGYDDNHYNNNYQMNTCMGGCPMNSHCEWGFCECNAGSTRRYGRCESNWDNIPPRPSSFDPFKTCSSTTTCMAMDMNLICNTDLTTQGTIGKCECRRDMRWNAQTGECQIYMDVDCSKITYETPPSSAVLSAVEKAQLAGITQSTEPLGRTETIQETLSSSLLTQMDPKQASEGDLREAFCRDIDAYSFDMQPTVSARSGLQPVQPMRDERPAGCDVVPSSACAIAYDSGTCSGGWKLVIPMGELRFRWFSSYFSYRNDMDTVGVRAGCTFTGYSDSKFNGDRIDIKADSYDRWVVFADHAQYKHMDGDIESLRCVCRH